ncbi:MAG: stage II sporulation protein P [Clostridia bacterium]|nr:stage II sporulation protein P [Clostridia bacterium]
MKLIRIGLFIALASLFACSAAAESEERVYTLFDEEGTRVTSRMGAMYVGDEYISHDNILYEIVSVDDENSKATARRIGPEPEVSEKTIKALAEQRKLICMYSTHSDESYIPGDGDYSLDKNAGIYDVGEAFQKHLESLGYEVEYSKDTFLPHDAGAYRRSRAVAEDYAERMPAAIIDIHRDGISKDEYETTVDGEETSKVRLFVGKTNQNASENRAFAKKLKAIADGKYPGLVKDIFIGKGNYNQDLYPRAILLEFGTHEMDKDLVIGSTEYMAEVVNTALGGSKGSAAKAETKEEKTASFKSAGVIIAVAVAGIVVFALFSTGSFKGAGERIKKTAGEITGGLFKGNRRK